MAFRRGLALVVGQSALVAIGALGVAAWRQGFVATVVVLLLAGVWIAAETVARAAASPVPRPVQPRSVQAARQPDTSGKWRAIVDQAPAPLIALHENGALHAVNRAARALFQTDDRIVAPAAELVAGLQAPDACEMKSLALATPNGRRAFALQVADVADETGVGRLGVLIDIQAEIHAAEAKALRDLLAVLSHEIMNSLTPVASLAETAADYLEGESSPSTRAAREALTILARRAGGLARFVEAYRTLARVPPPALRKTSLAALMAEVAAVFRASWAQRGVTLSVELPPPDVILDLDPDLVTQALLNLLTNAAEAASQTAVHPEVWLSARQRAGRTEIRIRDNGPGVLAEVQDSLFHPFVTTKPQGAGVGLNLARQIALSHGGDLTLVPTPPGGGAVFSLMM